MLHVGVDLMCNQSREIHEQLPQAVGEGVQKVLAGGRGIGSGQGSSCHSQVQAFEGHSSVSM